MNVPQTSKWIENLSPAIPLEKAAKRSLRLRLDAVRFLLFEATNAGENESEMIHQTRVASRRAQAALDLYRRFLPERRRNWIEKRLKKLRRAAGPARDLDVLLTHIRQAAGSVLGASAAMAEFAEERAAARSKFRKRHRRLRRSNRLRRRLKSLPRRVRPQGEETDAASAHPFFDWSRTQLRQVVQNFFDAAPRELSDTCALHRFRITCKRLRYTIELVGSAYLPELREVAYSKLGTLQAMLGEINDWAMVRSTLVERIESSDETIPLPVWRELLHHCEERLSGALERFGTEWSNELMHSLGECFEEMLADCGETCEPVR